MAKAIRLMQQLGMAESERLAGLRDRLREGISEIEGCVINTPAHGAAPHILNLSVPGVKAEVLVHALEERGFLLSTKSACSSKADEPSRVLTAIGLDRDCAVSSLRISLGRENTAEQAEAFIRALRECVAQLRSYMKQKSGSR
jgi:cysteine desulfurase